MEFDLDITRLFPNRITTLTPSVLNHLVKRDSDLKQQYKSVIDALGKSSAQAQALPTVITLFNKFLIADEACRLFVLRDGGSRGEGGEAGGDDGKGVDCTQDLTAERIDVDADEKDGVSDNNHNNAKSSSALPVKKGAVLGFLKVGPKDLFLHNEVEDLVKVRPICVLDFYVSENCQRQGCGKILFDFMLDSINGNEEGGRNEFLATDGPSLVTLKPRHLAYDRPSDKLRPFLKKHYGLSDAIPQFNKFFIASGFFDNDNPCWDNNNNYASRQQRRHNVGGGNGAGGRMSQSKSGGFYPYPDSRNNGGGGAATFGGGRGDGEMRTAGGPFSRSPMTRRCLSEDSVSAADYEGEGSSYLPLIGQSRPSMVGQNRPKSDMSPNDRGTGRGILRGLENVAIGSAGNQSGKFSRHFSAAHPHQQPSPAQPPLPQQPQFAPNPPSQKSPPRQQLEQTKQPNRTSESKPMTKANSPPTSLALSTDQREAQPEAITSLPRDSALSNDSRMSSARDWTMTPRMPIGSQISNPGGQGRPMDPLSPSASTVSNAFIWMPSAEPVNHRVRAPYATTTAANAGGHASPASAASKSHAATAAVSPTAVNGNRRFQRTSLW